MASDKDRAKIMAEYLQHDDDDDDDEEEEEFQEDDYEDDDEDDDDDDDNQDATNPQSTNEHYAILNGHLTLNDEGRLVYSGTWCMKKDLELHESLHDAEKKKTKFKLKSKQALGANGKFDLLNPLLSSSSSGANKTRIVVMDGFFTTDKTDAIEPHRKIKEQNVEFVFSQGVPMMKRDDGSGSGSGSATHDTKMNQACFVVKGTGTNDFGNFTLEGIYCPDDDSKKDPARQVLKCSKRYMFANTMKRGREYDSEDDYVISDDEAAGADVEELIGLADDAALSVEALRKKYYGGGGGGGAPDDDDDDDESTDEELDRKMPAKKLKTAHDDDDDDDDYNRGRGRGRGRGNDDDDDDGCGF